MSLIGWVEMSAYLYCPSSETAALLPAELGLGGGGEQQQQQGGQQGRAGGSHRQHVGHWTAGVLDHSARIYYYEQVDSGH